MAEEVDPQPSGAKAKRLPAWVWVLIGFGGLVLLAIVAAIAIPSKIRGHGGGWPPSGVDNLYAYATAQTMYVKTDWDGDGIKGYAHPFTNLYMNATAGNKVPPLIDKAFNDAAGPTGVPKQGHLFQDCRTIGGKPIDWSKDFALCTTPAIYEQGGCRTYVIKTDGQIWSKDFGKPQFVDDFPADPKAAGWTAEDW